MSCKTGKDIPGYEGRYSVDKFGNVYSNRRHYNEVAQRLDRWGYCIVTLRTHDGKPRIESVHRLVAKTFIPNPNGLPEVNHIDGKKTNNRIDNLEWVTRSENMKHAYSIGLYKQPPPKHTKPPKERMQRRGRKLTMEIAQSIRNEYIKRTKGHTIKALAEKYNVDSKTIRDILQNKIWRAL